MEFTYFPLWAKGPAPALALAHGGLEHTCKLQPLDASWPPKKASLTWSALPSLEVPGLGQVGQQIAILNFIAERGGPKLKGADEKEFAISQELMQEGEDIYCAIMNRGAATIFAKDKNKDTYEKFWADDAVVHNQQQGMTRFLQLLEKYYQDLKCSGGKFTASGVSVGECKLFESLHICVLIKAELLNGYPGLKEFYDRFKADPITADFLQTGGKFGPHGPEEGICTKYYILPE